MCFCRPNLLETQESVRIPVRRFTDAIRVGDLAEPSQAVRVWKVVGESGALVHALGRAEGWLVDRIDFSPGSNVFADPACSGHVNLTLRALDGCSLTSLDVDRLQSAVVRAASIMLFSPQQITRIGGPVEIGISQDSFSCHRGCRRTESYGHARPFQEQPATCRQATTRR